GTVLTYTDTGLSNGQTYYYQVSAVNEVSEGPKSNEANATPAGLPSPPENLQATADLSSINLTWEAPTSDGGSP
ncbi:MAG: fibronectin type III domain-containing protein, partial [Candidatus Thermoplasmatota archaeon]|nr:fibronectin type III domain-containing protein [Candidatus Thermoplasmatota archaeon]